MYNFSYFCFLFNRHVLNSELLLRLSKEKHHPNFSSVQLVLSKEQIFSQVCQIKKLLWLFVTSKLFAIRIFFSHIF